MCVCMCMIVPLLSPSSFFPIPAFALVIDIHCLLWREWENMKCVIFIFPYSFYTDNKKVSETTFFEYFTIEQVMLKRKP